MKTPAETVVFDKAAKRFVLLNMADGTRAELTARRSYRLRRPVRRAG